MTTGRALWIALTLAVVAVAALSLPRATRGQNSVVADKSGLKLKGGFIGFPQVAANVVQGLKLHTNLVNIGDDPVDVVVATFDSNGNLIQQDPVTVAPGAMASSEFTCTTLPSTTGGPPATAPLVSPPVNPSCPGAPTAPAAADGSTPVRTTLFYKVDFKDVLITSAALVCEDPIHQVACGGPGAGAQGTPGPTSMERLSSNHNETLVSDVAPMP